MKRLMLLMTSLILISCYALYLNLFNITTLKVELEPHNPDGYYDYRGITHIHSNFSNRQWATFRNHRGR